MQRILKRLWLEDDGAVLSSEMLMYGSVGVVGMTAGYGTLRDTLNSELDDVAQSLGSIDQSYYLSGTMGHCAWTAGSAFIDRADRPDYPSKCVVTNVPAYGVAVPQGQGYTRPTVCADIFGAPAPSYVPQPQFVPGQPGVVVPGYVPAPVYVPAPGVSPAPGHVVPPPPGPRPGPAAGRPEPRREDGKKTDAKKKDDDDKRRDDDDDDDDRDEARRRPQGPAPHAGHHHPHPHPAVVVGAPGLAPHAGPVAGAPVRVLVNPWAAGGYPVIDVPEGYFNARPGTIVGPPGFQMMVPCGPSYVGCGNYCYTAPVAAPAGGAPAQIDLGFTQIGDAELAHVEKFKTARCLHVLGSNVTNKGIESISELEDLESLHIVGTQISNDGLKHLLKLKKLRFLHLIGTRITDEGLKHIAGMKQLEELDCRGSTVTVEGLDRLQRELPSLRIVR